MEYRRFLPLLLIFSGALASSAQTNWDEQAFRSFSPAQRARFIHDLKPEKPDSAAFMALYRPLYDLARAAGDQRASWLLQFYYFQQRTNLRLTPADNIRLLTELEKTAAEEGWPIERTVARHYLVFEQYYAGQVPAEALYVAILKEFEEMEEMGFEAFRDYEIAWLLYHNGRFMYQMEDLDKALQYFRVAERFVEPTEDGWHHYVLVMNHLQTIYEDEGDYSKGIEYARKILQLTESLPHRDPDQARFLRQWQGLSSVDIASMLVRQGKFAEGEAIADQGYGLAKAVVLADTMPALNMEYEALQVLIAIKLELGKLDEVKGLLHRSDELYHRVGWHYDNNSNNIEYFDCHSKYAEKRGDFASAMNFARRAKHLQDSLDQRNDAHKLERLQRRLEAERHARQLDMVEKEKDLQKWLRNAAYAIIVLLLLLAYGWFHRQRHLRLQQIAELEAARAELNQLMQDFREKTDLASNLRQEIESLAAAGERSQYFEQLVNSTILTDHDWLRFRSLFEKVNPGFIEAQKTLYPDLTAAELRYLVLEKLQLSTHEMANMLGVSDNTIRQTRARLRRKTS